MLYARKLQRTCLGFSVMQTTLLHLLWSMDAIKMEWTTMNLSFICYYCVCIMTYVDQYDNLNCCQYNYRSACSIDLYCSCFVDEVVWNMYIKTVTADRKVHVSLAFCGGKPDSYNAGKSTYLTYIILVEC